MRVVFDLAHPAHVHLYRHLIGRVQREGGDVLVLTREKDVTVDLCRAYGIPQRVLSRSRPGTAAAAWELLRRTSQVAAAAFRFRPDALVGSSASIGPVGRLLRRPSFVFTEDDAAVVPLFAKVTYPFCTWIVTPAALGHEAHGPKHLTYPGYHELAYLHPAHFTPDPAVPRSLGLDAGQPYFLVRFVALRGHHDAGAKGLPLDSARRLVRLLAARGRVLISAEGPLLDEFAPHRLALPPEKLHHLLAFAALYAGDSQTMSIEAGVLGIPNLRCNTFVGRLSVLEELDHRHRLTHGFLPDRADEMVALAETWLKDLDAVRAETRARREAMLAGAVDLAEWQWETLRARVSPCAA